MNLHQLIFVNNPCYIAGRKITPRGIMVHSTGANNPTLKRYVGPDDGLLGQNIYNNHWNQAGTRRVCVHGFIGKLADGTVATYQTLPWNHRAWHCAGSGNDTHISFEMCEDNLKNKGYLSAVWAEATQLCAMLCRMYSLPVSSIVGHYEGYKMGIANNHGDPQNWFKPNGLSMDMFRAEVQRLLLGEAPEVIIKGDETMNFTHKWAKINTKYDAGLSLWTNPQRSQGLVKVAKGEIIKVLTDDDSGWVFAEYAGFKGYVDKQYLIAADAPVTEPGAGYAAELLQIASRLTVIAQELAK